MPFRYLKDPLFLTCFAAYWLHRIARQWSCTSLLSEAYLNDVVCVGFWVPIVLWAHRKLGLRTHDAVPEGFEIVIPAITWALVFEVVLPASPWWSPYAVADPNDVCCYFVGGLTAMVFWQWYYGLALEQRHADAKCDVRLGSQDGKVR
jgi:hypothetical protein